MSGKGRAEEDGEKERGFFFWGGGGGGGGRVLREWVGERLGKHGRRMREGERV